MPSAVVPARRYRAELERWAWTLAPVWTALGALLLDLFLLGRRSLRFEEAQALDAAGGSWSYLWAALRDDEAPHAVVDVVLKGWIALGGDSEWMLRLPAAVAGAIAVGLTCLLGTKLLSRGAGLVAAGVLATNAGVVAWSQTARSESFVLAAVVLATLAFVGALERPARWRWALWSLATALSLAVSLLAVPVVAAHAVTFLVRRPRPEWRAPAVALAAVAAVACTTALLVGTAATIAGGLPDGRELGLGLWRLVGSSPVPLVIAALGLFVLVTARVAGGATWKTALLGTWLVAPVAAGLVVSLARSSFDPRYAVAAVPALALLVAAGVVSQRRWIAFTLLALLGASAAVALAFWYSGPSDENWRAAVAAIRAEQRPGEAVIVLPTRQRVAAAYYAGEGYAIERPHGHKVWLLLADDDAGRRLQLARALVHPPRYALLEEREFGDGLWLQVWDEP